MWRKKWPDFTRNHRGFISLSKFSKVFLIIKVRHRDIQPPNKRFLFSDLGYHTHKWTIRALFWTGRQASSSGTFIMCNADINSTWICRWSSSKGRICTIFHSRNIGLFEKFFSFPRLYWSSPSFWNFYIYLFLVSSFLENYSLKIRNRFNKNNIHLENVFCLIFLLDLFSKKKKKIRVYYSN